MAVASLAFGLSIDHKDSDARDGTKSVPPSGPFIIKYHIGGLLVDCSGRLVSHLRTWHHLSVHSCANFGMEGHEQLIDPVRLWFRSSHEAIRARDKGCGV